MREGKHGRTKMDMDWVIVTIILLGVAAIGGIAANLYLSEMRGRRLERMITPAHLSYQTLNGQAMEDVEVARGCALGGSSHPV
jgi:hypothetical protein